MTGTIDQGCSLTNEWIFEAILNGAESQRLPLTHDRDRGFLAEFILSEAEGLEMTRGQGVEFTAQ